MPGPGQIRAELVDEGRLADTGNAGDADAPRAARVRKQLDQQLLRLRPVVLPVGLDERDRPRQQAAVAREDTLASAPTSILRGKVQDSWAVSCPMRSIAASAITVPGPKIAAAPAARSSS